MLNLPLIAPAIVTVKTLRIGAKYQNASVNNAVVTIMILFLLVY
jgi:hypothetical protein